MATYLLFTVAIIFVYVVNKLRLRFRSGLRHLPGPRFAAYSRLWNIRTAASGDSHRNFQALHQKYGKVVRVGPNHVSISDPAAIPIVFGTNSKFLKTEFYSTLDTPYQWETMTSMFTARDPARHKHLKQAVSNKYSLSALRGMEPQIDECNDLFVSKMERFASDGQVVDLGEWLQWYAFDTIGTITFNRQFGFMDEEKDVDDIIAGIEMGLWYASIVGQVPELHPFLIGNNRLMKLLDNIPVVRAASPVPKVAKMVEVAIEKYDEVESKDPGRSDFLAWFRSEAQKSADKMSHRDLMNHLMNNLLAGSDTTAISLRAVFYFLIKNPRCYEKVMEEIDAVDAGNEGNISWTTSQKLLYLQACIKEAMRLHPGVGMPLLRSVPEEGIRLESAKIPGGTIIGISAWVIHHDESIYGANTDEFRPERWLEADPDQLKLMDKCFLSFGAGTRTCIGKNISILEMNKMIPQVLKKFRIEWASPDEHWKISSFWFAKQTGLKVRFYPREKQSVT